MPTMKRMRQENRKLSIMEDYVSLKHFSYFQLWLEKENVFSTFWRCRRWGLPLWFRVSLAVQLSTANFGTQPDKHHGVQLATVLGGRSKSNQISEENYVGKQRKGETGQWGKQGNAVQCIYLQQEAIYLLLRIKKKKDRNHIKSSSPERASMGWTGWREFTGADLSSKATLGPSGPTPQSIRPWLQESGSMRVRPLVWTPRSMNSSKLQDPAFPFTPILQSSFTNSESSTRCVFGWELLEETELKLEMMNQATVLIKPLWNKQKV